MTVTVTISGGQIVEASYSTLDDEEYFDEAWNSIYNQVLGSQSADSLDAVSGAILLLCRVSFRHFRMH